MPVRRAERAANDMLQRVDVFRKGDLLKLGQRPGFARSFQKCRRFGERAMRWIFFDCNGCLRAVLFDMQECEFFKYGEGLLPLSFAEAFDKACEPFFEIVCG